MTADLVAAPDAAGLPGPPWLFHVLLVLTFFLHLVFMNLTLGGTLLAWVSHLRAGTRADDPNRVLAARMMGVNTFAISLAITTGVAPLLFIQLLYQPFFYSGTILLGWIWFAMLVLLVAGYYAAYAYKFRGAPAGRAGGGVWLGASAIAFLVIAVIHVAVHLVHVQPGRWPEYSRAALGVLSDPTFWPRLLHFVLAGVAFAALVVAWWASRRASQGVDVTINAAIARTCWRWALWSTVLQVVDGFVLLMLLPREVMLGVMRGGAATVVPLALSILLAVGILVMLARSFDPLAHRRLLDGILAATLLIVAVMSVVRHEVRVLYLRPFTELAELEIAPQWFNFALFAVLLVVALGVVAYMARRALTEPAAGDGAA